MGGGAAFGWFAGADSAQRFATPAASLQVALGWMVSGLILSFTAAIWLAVLARVSGQGAPGLVVPRREARG